MEEKENGSVSDTEQDEKKYENVMKRQLMILQTLGKDYLDICLINIKRKNAVILKCDRGNPRSVMEADEEIPYDVMCRSSIKKFAAGDQADDLIEKTKLEHVQQELKDKAEYSFVCEVRVAGQIHDCQLKYMSMEDQEHMLLGFRLVDDLVAKEKEQNKEKIERSAEALDKERMFLDVLCRDYTSVYYFDLNRDTLEILKMDAKANAASIVGTKLRQKMDYSQEMRKYCAVHVVEENREAFLKAMKRENIQKELQKSKRFTFRYRSVPNPAGHCFFEAQALRVAEDAFDNTAILAFLHIDDVVADEERRRKEREAAREIEEKTKRLEQEKENAIAANEMKSRFLSSLSHDIRTPINGIQGMLRIADHYPDDLKKQSECRAKMWMASNYLVSLVNNVLNMNRLENKALDLTEQPFNLIDLLMELTSLTDMQADAQELHSIVDWKPGYIKHRYLIGSAEGLSRILMNLNSNAIKYNRKGGTIYCRCLETECDGKKAWFEFVTEDTGIGMDEEFLKHAFEPYVQKNNSSLNSINGVGRGLSIVKQTVEQMGGSIQVKSKVGEGTKYTIMLPFQIDQNPPAENKNAEPVSMEGTSALLVEDNELNLEISKFLLEQEKIKVFTAANGQEAVDMFRESKPGFYDVILMDIMMPVMNGLEAAKCIRKMKRADAAAVPIIAMSANAFEQDIKKSLEAGMNAHLTKPLDSRLLMETMKKYLANKIQK